MVARERVLLSWSGGKDSAMALHTLHQEGRYEVVELLTTVSGEFDRVSHHGVCTELLQQQAQAIGLPLQVLRLPSGDNALCDGQAYAELMQRTMLSYRAAGITAVAFGDLFLEELRAYRERNLQSVGMRALFPVWGRNTQDRMRQFLAIGFKAYRALTKSWGQSSPAAPWTLVAFRHFRPASIPVVSLASTIRSSTTVPFSARRFRPALARFSGAARIGSQTCFRTMTFSIAIHEGEFAMGSSRALVVVAMIAFAAASRLLPHPPNLTPLTSIALFGGAHLANRWVALLIPLAAMVLSSAALGWIQYGYAAVPIAPYVYVSVAVTVALGRRLRRGGGILAVAGATLASALLFFAITNFGVWFNSHDYPPTLAGLATCYVAAIPFLGNALIGDALYVLVLFGGHAAFERRRCFANRFLQRARA